MNEVLLIDSFLLLLVTITAVAVVQTRSLYAAAMLSGIYSLLMALVWVNMHSMDVAFTEAAVGGGISTILLLGTLVHTARDEKPPKGERKRRRRRVRWGALVVTFATGAALVYGTLDMPRFGDPSAPIHHHRVPEMMNQTVAFTGHVPGKQPVPPGWTARADLQLPPDLQARFTGNRISQGAISRSSRPSPSRRRSVAGSRYQSSDASSTPAGTISSIAARPGRCLSTNGASQSPATKPSTTVGSASMVSIAGLVRLRALRLMKQAE